MGFPKELLPSIRGPRLSLPSWFLLSGFLVSSTDSLIDHVWFATRS